MPFWEKVIAVTCALCILVGAPYMAFSVKDPREKKCIDGTLYWLTDQGYWLAYNKKCKVLTKGDEDER